MSEHRHRTQYDWPGVRDFSIWYVSLFLEFAADTSAPETAVRTFCRRARERPLSWWRLRKIKDGNVRAIVSVITSDLAEAMAIRSLLPDQYLETVRCARGWLELLRAQSDAGVDAGTVLQEMERIENEISAE